MSWHDDDLGQLGGELRRALADGGCAAVICNTVARAQEVYLALKPFFPGNADDGLSQLGLFHARYPFEERDAREKQALRRFGRSDDPNVKRPRTAVLVATQVIEQSLDLDFDLTITELAPVDLVLQRAGRLHRHNRPRPLALAEPQLWVLKPKVADDEVPDFGASKWVYEERVLLRSWLALSGRSLRTVEIQIPADVEELIESVYDSRHCPENLPDALRTTWQASEAALTAKRTRLKYLADRNQIASPFDEADILEDFNRDLREEEDPNLHNTLVALTRNSDVSSLSLVCLFASAGGPRLRPDSPTVVVLEDPPTAELARELVKRAVSISHVGVTPSLSRQECPKGWRKSPLLRHRRAILFDGAGKCDCGDYTLELNSELGLRVLRGSAGSGDHGEGTIAFEY